MMHLKTARRIARLTQAELARKVGVEQATISMLENGQIRRPSYELVTRLAAVLNISPAELFPVVDAESKA